MLGVIKAANAAVMFFLEIGTLAVVCYWGFANGWSWPAKIVAGVGAPVLLAVLWGLFAAGGGENATYPLRGLLRAAFEIAWFGSGAVALYAAVSVGPAVIFAAVYLVNALLRLVWNQT
ncbi:MAG: YrdB family protein [Mycobacteriaceae bacterium]|nr:YrdB family protein [Mycobacteriaceae bacterium]